ncbi:MAG TPA: rod shape-determining protein MreC [Terriglobales bacterium]|jgi:rod shape-determining protein MreC|nr:rod shape-determining protein MreC [Terriglobales bacterium]
MENLISRYRNVTILAVILFAQVLGLAVQVKRSGGEESTRLIRLWTVSAVAPLEKVIIWCESGVGNLWHDYVYLRGVRQENRDLKFEIERLRLEQVRLSDDARQARRLQALLGFKEQYIARTVAAQVIGTSGSEQSRSVYIDKGAHNGVEKDMAVITADGVVGKVLRAFGSTAQVLLINDYSSGVGAIVDKSRSQGVVRGTPAGEVILANVMTGELVEPGELVVTSGGDQIFPKGLPVGTVMKVSPGADLFLNIRVKPTVNLNQLEEVLVITKKEERAPAVAETNSVRAVDILTQRLPSVPDKPAVEAKQAPTSAAAPKAPSSASDSKPAVKSGDPAAGAAKPTGSPKPALRSQQAEKTGTGVASEPAASEDKPH